MESPTKTLHWKDRSHRFTPHFHTEFYVGAIVRGCCEFEASGRRYDARPGDLVLINPFEVHTAGCSPDVEYRAVYFADRLAHPRWSGRGGPSFVSFEQTVVRASPLAHRLAEVLEGKHGAHMLPTCLETILSAHATRREPDVDPHEFQARVIDAFSDARLEEASASIAAVAARLGMNAQHFSRVFHRVFGVPAVFFRNQLRMHRAEERLIDGAKPAEVAFECGFSDQAHLIREMKKVRGVTPKLYAAAYESRA